MSESPECGVPLVWLVDPERRTFEVCRGLPDTEELTVEDTIDGGDVLPGFTSEVARSL